MENLGTVAQGPLIPEVRREARSGDWTLDVFSRLLADRVVILGEPVGPDLANVVMAQLLHLEAEDPNKDVALYINAYGGDPASVLAILDTMDYVRCDVGTFCFGQAGDVAAVLLAGGEPGKRAALPHARVVLSQPAAEIQGQSDDIETHARKLLRLHELLTTILAERAGRPPEPVLADTDRDLVLTADGAREYGLVDAVLERRPDA